MISEQLFNEVMGVKILEELAYDDTYIAYAVPRGETHYDWENINIYELAWKCKNYVGEKYNITILELPYEVSAHWFDEEKEKEMAYYVTGEENPYDVERVFKCCEWILERIKNG